jgi:hypothetical protein
MRSTFFIQGALIVMLVCSATHTLTGQPNSNYTAIRHANIQIKGSLNNTPLAWATDTLHITLNKQTGEFEAQLLIDDLHYAAPNANFKGATGENQGKYLKLTGILPVDDVLTNANNAIDRKVEMTANFNDRDEQTYFTFTILTLQTGGFSVMAYGTISISELYIPNLAELDDDLNIVLSFTGF